LVEPRRVIYFKENECNILKRINILNKNLYTNIMSKTRIVQMSVVQTEALELFRKKNTDYGDAFATYGTVGVIVRMGDKIQRLLSISKKGIALVDNESLRDTLIDLHNYAAMGIMLIDEKTTTNEKNIAEPKNY
jgi:hypothetical protein